MTDKDGGRRSTQRSLEGRVHERARLQDEERRRTLNAGRMTLIGLLLVGAACVALFAVYVRTQAWQNLAAAALALVGGTLYLVARGIVRKGHLAGGSYLLYGTSLVVFLSFVLFWSGVSLGIAFGSLAFSLLLAGLVLPRRQFLWAALGSGSGSVLILILDRMVPWSRFDVVQVLALRTLIYAIIAAAVLAALWELVRTYRNIHTIRVRLLATSVLLVLLVAIAVSAGAILVSLNRAQQQAFRQLESVAALKGRELATWVEDLQSDLDALMVGEYELQRAHTVLMRDELGNPADAQDTLRTRLQRVTQRTQRFEELFLLDLDGTVVLSTDVSHEGRLDGDRAYFQRGREGPYVHPPSYYPSLGESSIVVARPIRDEHWDSIGVLAGRVRGDRLSEIALERTGLGDTGETYLVDANHTLVTELRHELEGGKSLPVGDYVRTEGVDVALSTRKSGSGIYVGYRGARVLGVHTWVPELRVVLMAEQEQDEVTRGAQVAVLVNAGVALASVLLAVVASVVFARSISRPLGDLSATATRIAAGETELTAEVVREDEIGALAGAFNSMTAQMRELIGSLEQRVSERTRGLRAVAEVSRATTSLLDPDALLRQVVDLVHERFGLYYVGLFLVDEERQFALLRAGTGEAGRRMLARGHRLEVGGSSMIGQCVASGLPDVQLDVGEASVRFDNPLLPDTRSELALPLRSGGRVIGAMTVQSAQEAAFDEAYVAVLQTLADQVAVAIANARLFAATQAALEQVQAVQRRYQGQAWAEYAGRRTVGGYEYRKGSRQVDAGVRPLEDDLLPEVRQAMAERRGEALRLTEVARGNGGRGSEQEEDLSMPSLVAPVEQGDRVVAALGFQREEGEWSADEAALVEAVAEQLSLAAENLRLLDDTQRRAAREEATLQITERVRAAPEIEDILQIAAQELSRQLSASEVVVRLGTESRLLGGNGAER